MNKLTTMSGDHVPSVASRFASLAANSDLSGGVGAGGYPSISYKGKVWTVVQGDNRTLITNDDGDPKASIEVVILKSNPHLSKIYYSGGYEEGSSAKPTCYSNDSITPAGDAQAPQSASCAVCPHNAWGSRITESGAKGKSCSDSRRLAVAPINDLENPMLLRIPAGSLKDLVGYADMLNRRKAPYQSLVTKIGFDHTVAYQKFAFKALRWLTDEEASVVMDVLDRDIVGKITAMDAAPLAIAGTPPKTKPAPEPEDDFMATPPKAVANPAPVQDFDDEEEAPKPKAKSKVAVQIEEADSSLDDVLGMLDE